MLIRILALSLVAPLMLLAACGDDDNATSTPKPAATTAHATATGGAVGTNPAASGAAEKDVTITAADFSLTPATITAAPGQKLKVTFKNTGAAEHSFTVGSTDVTEAEGGADASGEYTVQAGDTEFHCKYHPTQMKGTITVSATANIDGSGSGASASAAPGGISGFGY